MLVIETNDPENKPNGDFFARAIVFENDIETDAVSVTDIFESENVDVLRDMINSQHPDVTHYRSNSRNFDGTQFRTGNWSDALRVAKETAFELAHKLGANVRRNMSLRHLVEHRAIAIQARNEGERLTAERNAEKEARTANRERLAEERKDFDAWVAIARASRKDGDPNDYALCVLMRWAYAEVESFPAALATHVEKLTENPTYTLSWGGDFVQAAHTHDVAQHLVALFSAGVTFVDMLDEVMSNMFSKSDRATSRSTSVMSNLSDDCTRVAWTEAAKRITGKSFW